MAALPCWSNVGNKSHVAFPSPNPIQTMINEVNDTTQQSMEWEGHRDGIGTKTASSVEANPFVIPIPTKHNPSTVLAPPEEANPFISRNKSCRRKANTVSMYAKQRCSSLNDETNSLIDIFGSLFSVAFFMLCVWLFITGGSCTPPSGKDNPRDRLQQHIDKTQDGWNDFRHKNPGLFR